MGRRGGRRSASGRARSGWRATGPRARPGCWIAPRRRSVVANRTDEQTDRRRSRRCGGCGSPARRSPRCSDRPLSTVSGILTRIGMGKLGRLGLEPAERYERDRPGRADPHRRQEARAHRRRRRQAHPRRPAALHRLASPTRAGIAAATAGWDYVHVAIDDAHPPGLRRGARRREGHHRDRLPAPRGRVLRPPRHHRRAR